jgi:hypothetical protein
MRFGRNRQVRQAPSPPRWYAVRQTVASESDKSKSMSKTEEYELALAMCRAKAADAIWPQIRDMWLTLAASYKLLMDTDPPVTAARAPLLRELFLFQQTIVLALDQFVTTA